MKRVFAKCALLCTLMVASMPADAQISLGNILKKVASGNNEKTATETDSESKTGGILSALTNVFSGSKVATKDKLV